MERDFINKVHRNIVVLTNLRGQRRAPYLPEEELRALRDTRLRRIVKYAAKTAPYYRNLFQREKIDTREIKTVEDIDFLPLIDKKTVQKNPDLFISTSCRGRKSVPFITNGTAGMPLTVYHDQYPLLANIAYGERQRGVVMRIWGEGVWVQGGLYNLPGIKFQESRGFFIARERLFLFAWNVLHFPYWNRSIISSKRLGYHHRDIRSKRRDLLSNLSAGCGAFKVMRSVFPVVECNAVHDHHLPPRGHLA